MTEQDLEKATGKKFDIVLMNPPYGSVGGDTLHLQFVDKCLNVADKQITIMPISFITKLNKNNDKYKENFDKYLINVEEVDKRVFKDIGPTVNLGIYTFDEDKTNANINITWLNKDGEDLKSLFDISEFSNYEKEIIQYLEKNGRQLIYWCQGSYPRKGHLSTLSKDEQEKLIKKNFEKNIKNIKQFYNKQSGASLIVNSTNGQMNGTFMSSKVGQIFDNYNDIEEFFKNRKPGYNILMFNTVKEAENCKIALQNPLLRFTCYRTQNDQAMRGERVYRYIPAIDWSNDKVKTDEGLLELCGCPKDKCKEYAEYCKKIIDEVDNRKK